MDLFLLVKDGSHSISIQGIQDGQIVILCRVHAVILHSVVDRFLGKSVGEHHASRRVGIAPVSFVVILVISRSHVPAFVKRSGVIAVGREVAGASDSSLAVAHLDQRDLIVDHRVIEREVHEITEGVARVVELGDGLRIRVQRVIICFKHFIVVALLVRSCVSVFKSFRIEGIDMSRCSAGPGHLKSVDPDEVAFLRGDCSRALASFRPGSIYFLCILITKVRRPCAGKPALSLKGVGVVGQCKEIQIRHIRRMLKRLLYGACSVGKVCVGMELTEIQAVILDLHGRLICKCINLAGLRLRIAALRDICQRFHNDRSVFLRSCGNLKRLCVELFCISCLRVSRLCAVCIHRIVDLRPVSRFQSDFLPFHNTGAILRGRLHLKSFHC